MTKTLSLSDDASVIGGAIVEKRYRGNYLKGFVKIEETVKIPREVAYIDSASFVQIRDIVKVIIFEGSSVYRLQTGVFDGMTNLEEVEALNVYFIGKKVFKDALNLNSVTVSPKAKAKLGAFPKGLKVKKKVVTVYIGRPRYSVLAKKFTFEKKKK